MLRAVVRIAEVEPFGHLFLGIVGVTVQLHLVVEQVADVAEQLQLVLDRRVAPDLRRVGHVGVARGNQRRRVGALHAAIGRIGVAVLQAEIDESRVAERQSDVAGNGVRIAVARAVGAGVELQAAARAVVLEQEVHHAGNGVRAVLRRGAVAQHLDLAQRDRRNRRDVRPLRAIRHAGEPGNDRRTVPALAVDQHERMVVGQVAQAGRPDERGRVADRVRRDVERRHQGPQLVVERRGSLTDDILERQGVDRHRRGSHRSRLGAATDDHDPLLDGDHQLDIKGGRGAGPDVHPCPHDLAESGQREGHVVGAGIEGGDGERAGAVGRGGPDRTGSRRGPCFHRDAGQRESRRIGHRSGQLRGLHRGDANGRRQGDQHHRRDPNEAHRSVCLASHLWSPPWHIVVSIDAERL